MERGKNLWNIWRDESFQIILIQHHHIAQFPGPLFQLYSMCKMPLGICDAANLFPALYCTVLPPSLSLSQNDLPLPFYPSDVLLLLTEGRWEL